MTGSLLASLMLAGTTGSAISLLALAMPRHYASVFGSPAKGSRISALRLSGYLALAASLLVALSHWDGGLSLVTWVAYLTAESLVVGIALAYIPRAVLAMGSITAILGAAGVVWSFV